MPGASWCFLTCIHVSQEAGQVVWHSHFLQNFPQFIVIHTVEGFGVVNKAEIDVFLELSCFLDDLLQLLSHVQIFATPQTAARQAPLSFTISQSFLRFLSIELLMPYNHLILYCPLLLLQV